MKRAAPVDRESPFQLNELFFSRTDKRGIIRAGNAVFSRVSEIPLNDMIGSPHNIIRHPEMPKAVFKLFWDTIQANRPIGAYVKNMSASGAYYWVYAVAFPTPTGYLSLRLKPSTPLLGSVKQIYAKVLAEEKARGVGAGTALLNSLIEAQGHSTYEEFMTAALVAELLARDKALGGSSGTSVSTAHRFFSKALRGSARARADYELVFAALLRFLESGKSIRAQFEQTLVCFRNLNFLSINMAAGAERAGKNGRTLSEVSVGFKKVAEEIQDQVRVFNDVILRVLSSIGGSQFLIGGSRLQVEIISYFLAETAARATESSEVDSDFLVNYKDLLALSLDSSASVSGALGEMSKVLSDFVRSSETLLRTVCGLEVIRVTGKVEASRLMREDEQAFSTHLQEMAEFVGKLCAALKTLDNVATEFRSDLQLALEALARVKDVLQGIAPPETPRQASIPA